MFSLESPHRGDSNEDTDQTIISIKRQSPEIIPNTRTSAAMGLFLLGLNNEFEIAVVNEPSVFKPPNSIVYGGPFGHFRVSVLHQDTNFREKYPN